LSGRGCSSSSPSISSLVDRNESVSLEMGFCRVSGGGGGGCEAATGSAEVGFCGARFLDE